MKPTWFNFITSFIILLLFATCKSKEENTLFLLQGNWAFDFTSARTVRDISGSNYRDNCGFTFNGNMCELPCSFRSFDTLQNCFQPGYKTKFRILGDTLKIWNELTNDWNPYLIEFISKDSLVIDFPDQDLAKISYVRPKENEVIFNEIIMINILSDNSGKSSCSDEILYLNKSGVFFKSTVKELMSYPKIRNEDFLQISSSEVDKLFESFRYYDIKASSDLFIQSRGTVDPLRRCFSFYKDGEIIKKVYIQDESGPDELLWGYHRIERFDPLNVKNKSITHKNDLNRIKEEIKINFLEGVKSLKLPRFYGKTIEELESYLDGI